MFEVVVDAISLAAAIATIYQMLEFLLNYMINVKYCHCDEICEN